MNAFAAIVFASLLSPRLSDGTKPGPAGLRESPDRVHQIGSAHSWRKARQDRRRPRRCVP
jgi:hypothetical protein